MDGGALEVEVGPLAAPEDPQNDEVDHQAHGRDHQHGPAENLDRREQAARRLDQDPADDGDQGHAVDEGGQHLEAMVAIGAARVVGTPGDAERHPGERQGGGVGQHVAGVGDQRQRAGEQPAHHLGHREPAGQPQGDQHAARVIGRHLAVGVGVAVVMAVVVAVGVAVIAGLAGGLG